MKLVDFFQSHVEREAEDFRFVALKELIAKNLRGSSVVDVGCGTGMMVHELSQAGLDALGLEPEEKLFAIAEAVRDRSSRSYRLVRTGLEDLSPELLNGYGNVLLLDVLEHVKDDVAMLGRLHAAMAGGAQLICTLPAGESLYGERDRNVGHYRRYSEAAVRRLFDRVPFRNVEVRHWNLLGVPAYFFFERIARRPVPEGFRLEEQTPFSRALNRGLLGWFRVVENRLRPPLGLSLFVRAEK